MKTSVLRFYVFLSIQLITLGVYSQVKNQNIWRWGYGAGLNFNTSPPTVLPKIDLDAFATASSYCDPISGKLLFFTDGKGIFNSNNEFIGYLKSEYLKPIVIIASHQNSNHFYLIGPNAFTLYDVSANGGKGGIIGFGNTPFRNTINAVTAIKHCFNEEYWIIALERTDSNITLAASRLTKSGTWSKTIRSNFAINIGIFLTAFETNLQGLQIAFSNLLFPNNPNARGKSYLLDFDNKCGVFTSLKELPSYQNWDSPQGLCFSPDGNFLYANFQEQNQNSYYSLVIQYPINSLNNFKTVYRSSDMLFQMKLGPDGKIYINLSEKDNTKDKLEVIPFPNEPAPSCGYISNYIKLTAWHWNYLPSSVIANKDGGCTSIPFLMKMDIPKRICTGQKELFKVSFNEDTYEQVKWDFGDGTLFEGKEIEHSYHLPGEYIGYLFLSYCQNTDTILFKINVVEKDTVTKFYLGNDTIICSTDTIKLTSGLGYGLHLWNDGDTSKSKWVLKEGQYILQVKHDGCINADTINISYRPKVWTALGSEYFICEEEGDLVLLDAGKGFAHYLWTPTGDTSQWIVVGKKGAYWVLVEDFTGCKAEDGTVVHTRCDMHIHFPNAFSPNNDGLNDYFGPAGKDIIDLKMKVYDRWGALVWTGEGPQAQWDGKVNGSPAPAGVYSYQAVVMGAKKKVVYRKVFTGNCTLLN